MGASRHVPVMLEEVLHFLAPGPGRTVCDLTLGGGGHTRAFLEAGARVLALDFDPGPVERAREELAEHGDRFAATHAGLGDFATALDRWGVDQVDGIFMDLGLSSDQLDDPSRGFAFRLDGPLDLRFDPRHGEPASALLRHCREDELVRWLGEYGEIRRPRRLARRMLEAARRGELETTAQLRELVRSQLPGHMKPEPELARVFQALRLATSGELGELDRALADVPARLAPGGRFVALSYHSLEDRRVKHMLRDESSTGGGSRHLPDPTPREPRMRVLTPKVLRPGQEETTRNPRARSARLRAGERL